jgi:hypothetical protein
MTPETASKLTSLALGALLLLALCLIPTAAMAVGEFEPNEDSETAYGPLAAGVTYAATLESGEDFDNYYFYVTGKGSSWVEITIANTTVDGDGLFAELVDADEAALDEVYVPGEDFDLFEAELEPGVYYLAIQTELFEQFNETYEIRAEGGPGAFATQAEVQAQCRKATSSISKARAALQRAKRKLRQANKSGSRKRKAAARRAVKRAKARLRAARANSAPLCPIPA